MTMQVTRLDLAIHQVVGAIVVLTVTFTWTTDLYGSEWFNDFSSTAGLTLNGVAAGGVDNGIDPSPVLRLADTRVSVGGSAFTNDRIDVSAFSTSFQFRITNPGGIADVDGESGADGITFTIQSNSPAELGNLGVGIGYEDIFHSVAIEFDTWNNPAAHFPNANDPDSNHVGIDTSGSVTSVVTVPVTPRFDDGNLWYAWVDYDAADLEVRVNQTGIRPAAPTLSEAIDIPSLIGFGYVGFTAATGDAFGNHDIVSWHYVPEPSTLVLAGLGFVVMVGCLRTR